MEKCYLKNQNDISKSTIFLYGDSYAQQIVPSLSNLLNENNVYVASSRACPSWGFNRAEIRTKKCDQYWDIFLDYFKAKYKKGDVLVIANNFLYFNDSKKLFLNNSNIDNGKVLFHISKSIKSIRTQIGNDFKVIFISGVPVLKTSPVLCRQSWSELRDDCGVKNLESTQLLQTYKYFMKNLNQEQIYSINIHDFFMKLDSKIEKYYYNKDHLNLDGAMAVSDFLNNKLTNYLNL